MKPNNKDNTLEILAFIFIGLIAAVLTYAGYSAQTATTDPTIYGRIVSLPMVVSLYVVNPPQQEPTYSFVGCAGSFIIYSGIGICVLLIIQKWIKKNGGGKGGGGNRI
jgi:hypothetical protein